MIYHHPDKFADNKDWDCGDITFLICHVISCDCMFKDLRAFIGGAPHGKLALCLVAIGLVQVEI